MAADAVELATAYFSLVPSMEGSQADITKGLIPAAESAGDEAGDKAGKKFTGKFSGVMDSPAMQGGLLAGAAVVGLAVSNGFIDAVSAADASAKIAAQLNLDPAQQAAAGEVAGSLWAGAYGDSIEQVNGAVGAVMSSIDGMATASSADIEDITAKALNLATGFDVDVAEAVNTAGILMRTGLATDADHAMDLITSSMQKVPESVRGEILPVMDEYSKHFEGLGIDGETAMGMIAAAGGDGAIGMDKMGDALKEFTIRATDMSKGTVGAYEALGLNADEMTAKLLEGGPAANEAMGEIVNALQMTKDPAEQAALSLALFGTPLEDLGTDKIPDFLGMIDPMGDSFGSVAGAADDFGAKLNSGPGVALETLGRTVGTVFAEFATVALPAITAFSTWLTDNTWAIGAFAAVIGGALVVAFALWTASIWASTVALLANPVTWIVIGIVALIAALVLLLANWDAVAAWVSSVWSAVVAWAIQAWAGMVSGFTDLWNGFSGWFMGVLGGFVGWISGIWASVSSTAVSLWSGLWSGLTGLWAGFVGWFMGVVGGFVGWLAGIWSAIVSTATGFWDGLVAFVTGIPGRILAGLVVLSSLAGKAAEWFGSMKDAAVGKVEDLVAFVGRIPGNILGVLGDVGNLLWNAGSQIIDGFLNGLTAGFENVKNFVGGIGQWIADHKGPKAYDLALLVPAGGWIMDGLRSGIEDEIPALTQTLDDVTRAIEVNAPTNFGVDPASGALAAIAAVELPEGRGAGIEINNYNPVAEPASRTIETASSVLALAGDL